MGVARAARIPSREKWLVSRDAEISIDFPVWTKNAPRPWWRVRRRTLSLFMCFAWVGPASAQPAFVPLGDLSGGTLYDATGISADDRTIVGTGRNPNGQTEAWLAVPAPAMRTSPSFSPRSLASGLRSAVKATKALRRSGERTARRPRR